MNTYIPARNITVTDADKRAVWAALPPGTRLGLSELVARTGLRDAVVVEVWAMGYAAGKLVYVDGGVGDRGIERAEVTA